MRLLSSLPALLALGAVPAAASALQHGSIDDGPFPDDLNGSNFTYPRPVHLYRFTSQGNDLEMAFMDVAPPEGTPSNNKTAVLLHGKNFCAPTWGGTIDVLTAGGYRVVAPDQVGFCKSSKPAGYQYSLHQLAANTAALLDALEVDVATVMGHSLGGMLATRFGLMFPERTDALVIVNAVGLEDYTAKGVPYISIEETVETEAASTYESIRAYEEATYYVGEWREEYDTWVTMLANIYHGSEREAYLQIQARIVDLVLTQPVAHEFARLQPRTLLMIGEQDSTAIGAQWSPPEVAEKLGHFDELGPFVAGQLPNGELVRFPELGHAPQISDPELFHGELLGWLVKGE